MADSRKCGYCREIGHARPVCPTLHAQRRKIFDHAVSQRKRVYKEMVVAGYGVGAMIEAKSYNSNVRGIITGYAGGIDRMDTYSMNRVRYSKQVNVVYHTPVKSDYTYVGFQIAILGGGVGDIHLPYISFFYNEKEYETRTYGARILAPSYDMDESLTDAAFENNIVIHDRLALPIDMVGVPAYEASRLIRKNLLK